MNHDNPRRHVLRAGLALGATLALPQAHACEFFSTTMRINRPWSRATHGGATTAVLSMTFDQVLHDDRLIKVYTPVADGAEMGGPGARPGVDFAIPAGRESVLDENGIHLRLLRLRHPLEMGREYPLMLVFEKSGRVLADFDIDYA